MMNDLVTRLRDWRSLHLTRLGGLFDEAADRIELDARTISAMIADYQGLRDRCVNGVTLTDEEREAITDAARAYELDYDEEECAKIAATLRNLLGRLA